MTQGFLQLLGQDRTGTVIALNTGLATMVAPTMSAYSVSKIASLRLMEYVAAEYKNVNAVSIQPGVVDTEMVVGKSILIFASPCSMLTSFNSDSFKKFALDTPELVGGTCVWLATDSARFLSGRFISASWSVDDLLVQKDQILAGSDLTVTYAGKFGLEQFKA
jgi:NAD(P)-dependent dehydrogenase (short-subunit alcohol dehydrogenase family)